MEERYSIRSHLFKALDSQLGYPNNISYEQWPQSCL